MQGPSGDGSKAARAAADAAIAAFLLAVSSVTIMAADGTTFSDDARAINVIPLTVRTPHAGFNAWS